ncbi:MAG: UDP-N-acetylmuramoyl-L-alanyl-D-glutamate--2,6-diaminopimelate ligase [bacterium]|nr:UDP-N-acetylmuramoyl-L-alanyl-D-glutamate--2,6-diaminopimelate ligase [bacterium]
MRLHELMRELPVRHLPPDDPEVRGVCHDSRRIAPGELYVAIVGRRYDGRSFSPQAVERGAVAVLGPGRAPAGLGVPWIGVDDPRPLLGPIAARLYGGPHERLLLVGVTGTNGKSTVIALVARMLEAAGRPAGVVGTLGSRFGDRPFDAELAAGVRRPTTPEAPDLFRALDRMAAAGARAAVMEVSSHALAQGRVAGAEFDLAVFTNLTRDHLDFHGDLEGYFAAKRRLFAQLKPAGRAVVHLDDPYGRRLAAELPGALGFGNGGEVRLIAARPELGGIRARVATPRGELDCESPLLGRYNLENLLAAIAAAEGLELPHAAIVEAVAAQPPLPGRMEPVSAGQDFPVLIDYAHTPAALEAAVGSLRELSERRIVLVFGCGGDRDLGKREPMGRIAGEWADLPIATSDNPRGEDPHAILAVVEQGLRASGHSSYRVVPDRREAIRRAVEVAAASTADPGWAVLVAGKGHEEVQIVGDRETPFSDRRELEKALKEGTAA